MTDEASLDDVLGNEDEDLGGDLPLETQADEAPGAETDTDPPPGPDAKTADEPAAGKKPEDEDAEGAWTKRAVLDERRKRQELEREIAELRSRQNPDSAAPAPKARPDVFEDQDGAFSHVQQQFEQQRIADRIELSRAFMLDKHDDYEAAEAEFIDLVKADPALIEKMQRAPLPAKFVYEHVQQHRQIQELKDPEAYKAKLRAEVRAELEAELAAKGEEAAPSPEKTSPPPQLVHRRSAAKEPHQVESLEDILGA